MSASRLKYGSDALDELFAGDADKNYYDNDGNAAETARRSYFGRFSYDYRANISCRQSCVTTVRRISRKTTAGVSFPECRPVAHSEEPFVKDNLTWLSNLKLRASYGEQGNDQINAFQYVTTYAYSNSTVYKAKYDNKDVNFIIPGTTPNPFRRGRSPRPGMSVWTVRSGAGCCRGNWSIFTRAARTSSARAMPRFRITRD